MKKWVMINIVGLLTAAAVFSGSFIYAAANIEQAEEQPLPVRTSSDAADDFFQNDIGIADLLFTPSGRASSALSSEEASSEAVSSAVVSSAPAAPPPPSSEASSAPASSEAPSSEASSETVSSETPPPSSEVSSASSIAPPSYPIDQELLEILSGTVQREIVGTNTAPQAKYYEAYKAQAVASHSYMQYHKNKNGSYPTMSYSTPYQETRDLVASVLNEMMYYNGEVIMASYHAASGGYTQSASYIWGGNLGYLQAAPSAYDDYDATYTISKGDLRNKLSAAGISVGNDYETWFNLHGASYTDGGFVHQLPVGNSVITGRKLRENVLGAANLNSCKITSIVENEFQVTFTTKGYGHGAGMSQLGARGYSANEGYSYRQILMHYYAGVTIQ